jgi:uncharacterized membrane protein YcaP (DUF421 family)
MAAVFRAIFGYCFLVFMVRVVGRRPGKQMTPFDYVLIFFMGGLTLTPMVGNDRSVSNGVVIVVTIAVTHYALAWLKHWSPLIGRLVDGTPLLLLERGEWQQSTMDKLLVNEADVMAAARDRGIERLQDIEYATIERNGQVSVIARSDS